jgi:subtilisin-like proprotein convertase family protein
MITRAILQRIACIIIVEVSGSLVFANSSYIYQSSFNLAIPASSQPESEYGKGWMNDAVLEITSHHTICDVDIAIDLTHESLYDLQIVLQSSAGTNVILNSAGNDAFIIRDKNNRLTAFGGSGELIFDDESNTSIWQATAPFFSTPFKPVGSLSSFDNEDIYGKWKLKICDAYYAGTGTLNGVKLIITTSTPEPSSAILLALAAVGFRIFSNHRRS